MRVIDEDGTQLGIMPSDEAIRLAGRGLDLVEVAPKADPPVCRIMDYGKYKYQQQKKQQEARKKQSRSRSRRSSSGPRPTSTTSRPSSSISGAFWKDGDRCKVTVFFRGREIVHKDRGLTILERVAEDTEEMAKVEQSPAARAAP